MKIALITHNIVRHDGQGRVNLELSRYLAKQGHELHLYAHRVDSDLIAQGHIIHHPIPVFLARPILLKCLIFMIRATRKLSEARYDIVHLNGAVSLTPCDVNTCHLCHTTQKDLPENLQIRPWVTRLYYAFALWFNARLEKRIYLTQANHVVAVSGKVAQELVTKVGVPKKQVTVIYNGTDPVETEGMDPQASRQWLQGEFGLGQHDFVMVFAGDLKSNRKGLGFLLEAIHGLSNGPYVLLVAGNPQGSPFPQQVKDWGLSQKVRFLGFRRDLPQIIKGADALVFPTLYESFGLIVAEAMSAGIPIITSNATYCGAAELIRDGESGLLLNNPRNPDEIREKIEFLASDPALRARLGQNAQDTARQFTWERMGREYEMLYYEQATAKGKLSL